MKLSRNNGQSASAAENSQVKGFAFVSYLWIFFTPECLCLCLLDFAQSLRALVCMARKVLVARLKKKTHLSAKDFRFEATAFDNEGGA